MAYYDLKTGREKGREGTRIISLILADARIEAFCGFMRKSYCFYKTCYRGRLSPLIRDAAAATALTLPLLATVFARARSSHMAKTAARWAGPR